MEEVRRRKPYPEIEIVTKMEIEGEGPDRELVELERWIETEDGRKFYSESRKARQALSGLLHLFDDIDPSDTKEGFVPIKVAMMGNPAISAYLLGVNGMSIEEVSEKMGVKESTVSKHITRFRRRIE